MVENSGEYNAAESSSARSRSGPSSGRPRVSIVVAAYNAAATLGACIDSLLEQSYPSTELIVVDDGSTDDTPAILAKHPWHDRFESHRLINGGPSRARNLGITLARGDLIAFFDADLRAHPRCVEELVEALDGERVVSIGGIQRSPDDDTAFGKDVQKYFETVGFLTGYSQSRKGAGAFETAHNPSCNVIYRREVLKESGGFDEGLWPGEDVDLDRRLTLKGFRHLFQQSAIVYHFRPTDFRAFRRMMYSYGRAQCLLIRRYGVFRKLHWFPPAIVVVAAAALVGAFLVPVATGITLLTATAILLMITEYRRSKARMGGAFYKLLVANLESWLRGFFAELLRPRYKVSPSLLSQSTLKTGIP